MDDEVEIDDAESRGEPSRPHCDGLKFALFVNYCEKIRNTKDRKRKSNFLNKLFLKYRSPACSFFPVLRLLLPQWDMERSAYGIKQFNLAKKYIKLLSLPKKDPDAEKLLNYKAPKVAGFHAGDFADVAYSVLKIGIGNKMSSFTIGEVNEVLTNMSLCHVNKDTSGFEKEFSKLIDNLSALEQKWMIRIILKAMHLGLGHKAILNAFHPDAFDMQEVCNNLFKVCDVLRDPNKRLNEIEVSVFDAFRPMLSERCDVQNLSIKETHFVETKWDGERFQLHYKEGQFKYFSRNSFEYTNNFSYLSSKIIDQFSGVNCCILDGEMMGWNTTSKKYCSKGNNLDVKNLKEDNEIQPCFCVFDILLFNGVMLSNKPYHERMAVLDSLFEPLEGVIMLTDRIEVNSNEDVIRVLNEAIDNSTEGIIFKHPESVYKPNARNGGWFKIKPEYTEGAMVELDLLIVGGYYGEGRRHSGILSHFLLALSNPPPPESSSLMGELVTFCRVGSGLSTSELEKLFEKLKPHWKLYKPNEAPEYLLSAKEKPHYWISPEDSVLLQVKASEVVKSDSFGTGYTLRFVRTQAIRFDKPWFSCLTVEEFEKIRQAYDGKLTAGHIATKADIPKGRKRKDVNTSNIKKLKMDRESRIFDRKEIYIATGSEHFTVDDLKNIILKNHGIVTEMPVSSTFCVIAGKKNLRVKNLVSSKKHDILTTDWVERCTSNHRLMPLLPTDFISLTPETDAIVTTLFDRYKNSRGDLPSYEHICDIVSNFSHYGVSSFSREEIGDLYDLLFSNISSSLFSKIIAYFDIYSEIGKGEMLDISHVVSELYHFILLGGKMVQKINSETKYIIMHKDFMENHEEFKKLNVEIISHEWILRSISSGMLEDISDYSM